MCLNSRSCLIIWIVFCSFFHVCQKYCLEGWTHLSLLLWTCFRLNGYIISIHRPFTWSTLVPLSASGESADSVGGMRSPLESAAEDFSGVDCSTCCISLCWRIIITKLICDSVDGNADLNALIYYLDGTLHVARSRGWTWLQQAVRFLVVKKKWQ